MPGERGLLGELGGWSGRSHEQSKNTISGKSQAHDRFGRGPIHHQALEGRQGRFYRRSFAAIERMMEWFFEARSLSRTARSAAAARTLKAFLDKDRASKSS
jgi:hypothetical protein